MGLLAEGAWGGWMYFWSVPTVLMLYEQHPLPIHLPVWTTHSRTIAEASREAEDEDSGPFPFENQFS